ncbi:ABC transporter permease [Actinoplanes couchii]|uniref:ABC transporter permease n=1 Tax=Actinoplanes couchii TaxID=403638 RepID=A0ABQ3XKU7_9ACTN|nr:ABC transporter permease [Actinoplanes couchii]
MTAGLRRAVAAEWVKVYSVRSAVATLAMVPLLTVGIAVLVIVTGSLPPGETILAAGLGNAVPAQLVAGAFGAMLVAGEYGSGTIRPTLAAVPRRYLVLTAKALVAFLTVAVVALVAAGGAYLSGVLMADTARNPVGGVLPALPGFAVALGTVAMLGVAVGGLVRHPGAAVTAVTAILLGPLLIGPLLGDAGSGLIDASPTAGLQKLADSGAWPTLALITGYSLALLAVATVALHRRDA